MQDNDANKEAQKDSAHGQPGENRGKRGADEIDLMELLQKYIFPYTRLYVAAVFVGAVAATMLSYLFEAEYYTESVSMVNVSSSSNLLKAGAGGLSGLASLAGIDVNAGDSDSMFNTSYVSSRELEDAFIEEYDLRRELFPDEYKDGVYQDASASRDIYLRLLGPDYEDSGDNDVFLEPGPTKEQVHKKFAEVFDVSFDQKTYQVSVGVRWTDPIQAKTWANGYIQLANEILRKKAIDESGLRIGYLENQIRQRPEVEVQQAIYSVIEEEMKRMAVAESSDQFAFKVIQRAYLPERRVFPDRKMFLLGGAFLGFVCVMVFAVGADLFRSLRRSR